MTRLLPATPKNIALAAQTLRQGGLVAFPTETVYGLGANALDEQAAAAIFAAKGRPAHDPLIVHLASADQVAQAARQASEEARALMRLFWPGPLTLILPRHPQVPALVAAGLDTVAVRVPDHPVALALISMAGLPIAAPSANRFGHTSPTTAEHVWHDLRGRVDLILDGGPAPIGIESTVLDVSASPPRILRPGGVTRERLEAAIGPVAVAKRGKRPEAGLPSPGLLEKHYMPRAELILFTGRGAQQALMAHLLTERQARRVGVLATEEDAEALEKAGALIYRLGADLESIARRIYAGMRWLDSQGVDLILCRDFGGSGLGLAIQDRLRRAASRIVPGS